MSDDLKTAQDELRTCADLSVDMYQLLLFVRQWLADWENK